MKRGFLREKAIFQIFLLIVAFVYFSYAIKPVEAQSEVCCEKLKDSDEYCVYTEEENCDPNFKDAATSCEQTSFCKVGCCYDSDMGMCYKSVPRATCESYEGGSWHADDNCGSVATCEVGCCVIGSQCIFTTERNCGYEIEDYPDLEMIFHSDILTEPECQAVCRAGDQGCCINTDESCVYETREACDAAEGDFRIEQYCSGIDSCECSEQDSKICYDDDVYWVDSCGNKEGIAEDCDYARGTLCRVIDDEPQCSSVNCEDTYKDSKNVHDSHLGGSRKNGDAWCIYEGPTGEWLDRPGTRHYRHMCVNGEEIVESCRDLREEICIQGEEEGIAGSACVHNDIYESVVTEQLSTVPKGQKFWEEDGKCSEADIDCPVIWYRARSGASWECEGNCFCEMEAFLKTPPSGRLMVETESGELVEVEGAADTCKFMGDCGADYNIMGEFTDEGFTVTSVGKRGPPRTLSDAQKQQWDKVGVFGGMKTIYEKLMDLIEAYIAMGEEAEEEVDEILAQNQMYGMIANMVATVATALIGGIWGAVVGVVIMIFVIWYFMTGKTKTYNVKTECTPWQAPTGGDDCDECLNQEKAEELEFYDSCTEYKCKSLGQTCKFLEENAGTERQACFDGSSNDVNSPIISPWPEALTEDFTISTLTHGYEIEPKVDYYTIISFGIKTNELSQCKLSEEHITDYDEMVNYFGDSYYDFQHNMTVNANVGGQTYEYYVLCQDGNGNQNSAAYVIRFTTHDEPDRMPPNIEGTSIDDYGYVAVDVNKTTFALYLNEPANCKWSFTDQKYDTMEYEFNCEDSTNNALDYETYACYTELNLTTKGLNTYYFRCEDISDNLNQNQQSHEFHLTSTDALEITSYGPEGIIYETTTPTLTVTTASGAEEGIATCYYSDDETLNPDLWPEFYETGSTDHSQMLGPLSQGDYDYYLLCKDIALNEVNTSTSFTIGTDTVPPEVEYIYIDPQDLHVILDEIATCEYYNETFNYGEGNTMSGAGTTHHKVAVGEKYYYINCEDIYENHWNKPIIVHL